MKSNRIASVNIDTCDYCEASGLFVRAFFRFLLLALFTLYLRWKFLQLSAVTVAGKYLHVCLQPANATVLDAAGIVYGFLHRQH